MAQEERTIYVYENWRAESPTLLSVVRNPSPLSMIPRGWHLPKAPFPSTPISRFSVGGSMCRWISGFSACLLTPAQIAGADC